MPRPKNNILHDIFQKNDDNKFVCNKGNCYEKVLNSHTGNLERHLKSVHPELYSTYILQKNVVKNKTNIIRTKLLPKELNKANIELAIVELFTKNGRPLRLMQDRAFKILVQPVFDELNISVNEHSINERIIAFSRKLKAEIIDDLKGKLLSLKIDAATRQDLSVLGVSVQYIKNKCIEIKTLAVKELKSSHTDEYLKSVILEVLKEYVIDINQILTITTDNGANIFETVKDLNAELQNSSEEASADSSWSEDRMESITSNFSSYDITDVRCGAHTLQLCVHDVLKIPDIKEKLEKCRSVIKKLRTQTYQRILKNGPYTKPITDCVTRWTSTFDMLERLLEIKNIIDTLASENTNLRLSNDIWNFVNEFLLTFRPVYIATIKLQSAQVCFSELYVIIMDIIFQISGLPTNEMTLVLIDTLNNRKFKLFDSELFNVAVFLDPRIKICMDSTQKTRAKKYITSLQKRINSLKETTAKTISRSPAEENMEEPSTTNLVSTSFSEFLQSLDPVKPEPILSSLSHLEADLMVYERQSRLPLDSNIIDFWCTQNNTLSAIADIILAIPSTQVSVERLFSSLTYILSDQRNRLTALLEHILLVNLNGNFNYDD